MTRTKLFTGASMMAFGITALSPAAAAEAPAASSAAATADAERDGDIVVTAQRREERLIDVPISVSAVSGATLKEAGVKQPTDLVKLIPGITFQNVGAVSLFSIRGISLNDYGDANESPVAFYMDDVYIAALAATNGQMFDVDRVEVLRGPQGTLFGRNATGGLVQLISKKPTDTLTGDASIQYGSYNQVIAEAGIGGAITDGIRFRTSGIYNRDDGWQYNVTINTRLARTNRWALRQLLDIDLAPATTLSLNVHGSEAHDIAPGYGFRGLREASDPSANCTAPEVLALQCVSSEGFRDPDPNPRHVYSDIAAPQLQIRNLGASATVHSTLGNVKLTSVTAFERTKKFYEEDADASPEVAFLVDYNANRSQVSQELRANGDFGRLQLVAGLFYFHEKLYDGLVTLPIFLSYGTYGNQNQFDQTTDAGAVFAQADYKLTDTLTATAGIRYSKEKKSLIITDDFANPFYIDHETARASRVTWKAAVDWKFVPDWLAYASVATGFKSPAFNTTLSLQGGSTPAAPEKNTNFEIGIKGETADHRLQVSSAVFYTRYKDFQLVTIPNNATTPTSILFNADGARIHGAEVEVNARPVTGLTLNANAAWLETKIESPGLIVGDIPVDGNQLPRSPHWQVKGLAQYELGTSVGRFGIRANATYTSSTYSQESNDLISRVPAYTIVDAGVSWSPNGGHYRIEAFVENMFDKAYTTYRYVFYDANALQWGRPRMFGVRASTNW